MEHNLNNNNNQYYNMQKAAYENEYKNNEMKILNKENISCFSQQNNHKKMNSEHINFEEFNDFYNLLLIERNKNKELEEQIKTKSKIFFQAQKCIDQLNIKNDLFRIENEKLNQKI